MNVMFKNASILLLALSLSWLAYGGTYSSRQSSSSRSYSSGKSSSGSSSKSYSSSSGKSYSSSKPSSGSSSPSKSKSSFFFFGKAEKAQAKANSKETFTKYKSTQHSNSWRPAGYDYLKSQSKESYSTRPTRQQTVFKTYYSQPQAQAQAQHNDSTWNPFFWMWLLDRPNQQAAWVYNHRSEISDERYKELVAKNKDLESQVKALEDKKAAKDPNYAPTEIDKDLMYSDDYVKAVQEQKDDSDFNWLLWLVIFPSSLGLIGWGVYAIFFKKREF